MFYSVISVSVAMVQLRTDWSIHVCSVGLSLLVFCFSRASTEFPNPDWKLLNVSYLSYLSTWAQFLLVLVPSEDPGCLI